MCFNYDIYDAWCATLMVQGGCLHFCVMIDGARTGLKETRIHLWRMVTGVGIECQARMSKNDGEISKRPITINKFLQESVCSSKALILHPSRQSKSKSCPFMYMLGFRHPPIIPFVIEDLPLPMAVDEVEMLITGVDVPPG
nr:hypothetical protein [Tanacetum cinerariifolium]